MTIVRNFSNVAPGASSTGVIDASKGGTGLSSVGTSGYVLTSNGTAWTSAAAGGGSAFPTGTLMLFQQTAAPTGWTKQTTHDNKALRVVTGTAGTGGTVAFTTAFASGLSDNAVTLSTAQIPSHSHSYTGSTNNAVLVAAGESYASPQSSTTGAQGGGGSHTHTLPSFAVSYVDLIIASAN
jgi:hypothetical protein